jgi:hypothetical protein
VSGARDRGQALRRRRQSQLVRARQALDRVLDAQRDLLVAAAAHGDHGQRTAPARVARAAAGVVRGDARRDVDRDTAIERVVDAAGEVDRPGHSPRL